MAIAITEAITTIAEAERTFKLLRTEDEAFFLEWQTPLPELSDAERLLLDEARRRYLYQRSQGQLLLECCDVMGEKYNTEQVTSN